MCPVNGSCVHDQTTPFHVIWRIGISKSVGKNWIIILRQKIHTKIGHGQVNFKWNISWKMFYTKKKYYNLEENSKLNEIFMIFTNIFIKSLLKLFTKMELWLIRKLVNKYYEKFEWIESDMTFTHKSSFKKCVNCIFYTHDFKQNSKDSEEKNIFETSVLAVEYALGHTIIILNTNLFSPLLFNMT